MAKSIITENDEIINYENVVSVHVASKEKYGQSNKEIFLLCAEIVNGKIIVIGTYHSLEEAYDVYNSIADWLKKETFGVYDIFPTNTKMFKLMTTRLSDEI